jgi:hypothetical protein
MAQLIIDFFVNSSGGWTQTVDLGMLQLLNSYAQNGALIKLAKPYLSNWGRLY